ncbi:MAG: cyclic nucleotide-binding domain-containing protein [Verrucomicrobia bacterium]|nr:cyclic nucleotide-binding domain-containing protein [Verrucomicrobiota bacterium]
MKMGRSGWQGIFPGAKPKVFAKGEIMVVEGGLPKDLLVILSGRARVEKRIQGRDSLVLAKLGAGELIGELAILTGGRRSATVVAEGKVKALVIPANRVKALLGGGVGAKGKFQRQMLESLARRLVRLLEKLPVYQGAFGEPKTEAGLRSALEKMYAGWAV